MDRLGQGPSGDVALKLTQLSNAQVTRARPRCVVAVRSDAARAMRSRLRIASHRMRTLTCCGHIATKYFC